MTMKAKKSRTGSVLMILGAVMIAAALFLTASNIFEQHSADIASSEALSKILFGTPLTGDSTGETVIPDYVLNPDMDMPTEEVDGELYIGELDIPALGLSLPVISEWSGEALKKAPCRYFGSVYKGNMVIAGHNYQRHFSGIKNLSEGDAVSFTDIDGNVFLYRVAETENLGAYKTAEMTSGEYPLTLFTCTIGGSERVAVRCEAE